MKIEKEIEAPKKHPNAKYPFNAMDVGDSIFFEGEKLSPWCKPYVAAQSWGRKHGVKFQGRTVEGGMRIWRIE